jgi:hypothetical protein
MEGLRTMKIPMKNPKTGEIKQVKVGWSWTLFLFSGFIGIPLFLRKLYVWGGIFLALWIVNLLGPALAGQDAGAAIGATMFVVFLGLEIWIGIKGNEMTAKNYLELGWTFVDPDGDATKFAKGKWGIAV